MSKKPAISSFTKWMITVTVMLVAVMEVLDITIVNVSLREMMGTFGATVSEITWVITAYVVSAAIMMPLTGFLVDNFGRKRILLINIIGFLAASAACGFSTSLIEIIAFRALQGVFGASLIPLSQVILRDTFSRKELGKAMAIWAMGIMVAPILGPTLGGYITEHLSWHWVFFINIPVCTIAFVMTLSLITESKRNPKPIDWFGISLLAIGVGCFQTFIEEGYRYDWFASHTILALFLVSVFSIAAFIIHSRHTRYPVISFELFSNKQFLFCTLLLTLFTMGLFGALTLQPLMAEVLLGIPPSKTGLMMAPRGLASLLVMPFIPLLLRYINAKFLLVFGLLITAYGTWLMSQWNLQTDVYTMAMEGAVQGFGMSFIFAPLSTIVFDTLPQKLVASASGFFSFGRSIGLSVGVALLSTLLSHETQTNWNQLGQHITQFSTNLHHWLQLHGLNIHNPIAHQLLASTLYRQASMIAYLDAYLAAAALFVIIIPMVFLIPRGNVTNISMGAH